MTMEKFVAGQKFEQEIEVTLEHTTNRMGKPGADVLSTPALLGLMEGACIQQSEPYIPAEHTTVGYAVDGLRHLAPTPVGNKVVISVELTEVDRNPPDISDRGTRGRAARRDGNAQAGGDSHSVAGSHHR